MTLTGETAGSYTYMPREQVVDFKYSRPETDIWAIGATMYNLLTGEFPRNFLHSRDPLDVVLHGDIIPILSRDSSIPKDLAEIIDRAVRNDPAGRYQHAGEMLSALQRVYKVTPL
jgi:serine/threonine protein kinase